tara:strand:- start:60 stop:545 length:486 start_codon:yes stop_codon:yes gene_type:complete
MSYSNKIDLGSCDESIPAFKLFQETPGQKACFQKSLSGIQEGNNLSNTFFSSKNLDQLQSKIIESVLIESNNEYKIGRQSDTQLQIIMRSTYLSYSKNLSGYLEEQLNQLNDMVIKECVIRIMPEIKQYLGYREDVSKSREFMPLPQYLSESGKDTFPLIN